MQSKWTNIILLLLAVWVIMLVFKKMSKTDTNNDQEPSTVTTLPDDFLAFYDKFHKDSTFQMTHIDFPLEGIAKDSTRLKDILWTQDEWKLHKPFMQLTDFNRNYAINPKLVVETIEDRSEVFIMERRFLKENDQWKLVYYEEMGPKRSE